MAAGWTVLDKTELRWTGSDISTDKGNGLGFRPPATNVVFLLFFVFGFCGGMISRIITESFLFSFFSLIYFFANKEGGGKEEDDVVLE